MNSIERYTEMLSAKRTPFAMVDGQLFARHRHWITPVSPAAQRFVLARTQARDLLSKLGGWWVSWTEGFGVDVNNGGWHAVVCRQFVPLEEMPAKRRYEVNRGLKNCQVRRVDAAEVARHGYEVYAAALRGYANGSAPELPTPEQFAVRVQTDTPFADIKHHWAVYHQGRTIAFAHCYLHGSIEVNYTLIKLDPQQLELYPAYALIYRMNEFYLGAQGFQYVNDGWRSILHETGVQDFLIRKFNFEKASAILRVQFRQPLATMLQVSAPLHPVLRRVDKRLKALLELRRLRTATG